MNNKDELTNRLGGQIVSDAMKGVTAKDKSALIRLILSTVALLAVIGEEGIQVIFRKNFGAKGLNPYRIVGCSLLFGVISFLAFKSYKNTDFRFVDATSITFLLTGIFYLALALITLIKGFMAMKAAENSKKPIYFPGESELLAFLEKEYLKQPQVQNLAEPLLVLALGIFFSGINLLWGLPLVYCAIAVWINKVVEMIFLEPSTQEQPNQQSNRRSFSEMDN